MSKRTFLLIFILFLSMLAACNSNGPIQPDDKVGVFTVTQGGEEAVQKVIGSWGSQSCQQQVEDSTWTCQLATGEKANISVGVYSENPAEKSLDTIWDEHTFELLINDRPVDLAAFGTLDVTHPYVGQMRWYDIAIQADQPGEIVVRSDGVVNGKAFTDTTTYVVTEP